MSSGPRITSPSDCRIIRPLLTWKDFENHPIRRRYRIRQAFRWVRIDILGGFTLRSWYLLTRKERARAEGNEEGRPAGETQYWKSINIDVKVVPPLLQRCSFGSLTTQNYTRARSQFYLTYHPLDVKKSAKAASRSNSMFLSLPVAQLSGSL